MKKEYVDILTRLGYKEKKEDLWSMFVAGVGYVHWDFRKNPEGHMFVALGKSVGGGFMDDSEVKNLKEYNDFRACQENPVGATETPQAALSPIGGGKPVGVDWDAKDRRMARMNALNNSVGFVNTMVLMGVWKPKDLKDGFDCCEEYMQKFFSLIYCVEAGKS